MEISVGIYAVVFIFFFLVIPGFIFRRFYYHGEFSKQLNLSTNSITSLVSALFIGIALTLGFVALHNIFSSNPINLDKALNTFDQNFVNQTDSVSPELKSINKFEGFSKAIYTKYLMYLGAFYAFSALIGFFLSKMILFLGLDTSIKFLRFRNEWHYLFSGKILKFRTLKNSNSEQNLKVKYTYVDVLVSEKDDDTTLYSGLFADYEINANDHCKLEKIHLLKAVRYKKDDKGKFVERIIPGNVFTILGDKILNINSTYICFNEEETKNKKFKVKRGFLFFGQIISTIVFLSFLISFTFSVNFFDFNWFESVLKQHYLVKAGIVLTLNIALGLITPFTLDVKNKRTPFIGWSAMIAKIILSVIGFCLIYYFYKF